jgi:hypothetical protein
MPDKRSVVNLLDLSELRHVVRRFGLAASNLDDHAALVASVVEAKTATLSKILSELPVERLRSLCRAAAVPDDGHNLPTLVRRLTGTDSSVRLFGIVAREARKAVVFRRGPSKQVRMLLWDLATDEVTPGQWLSGRIYEERCGVSPDGQLLVYFAGKFKTKLGTFTAVSRPPFFTALALWPDGSTYGGGGFFEDNRKLILNYGYVLAELNESRGIPSEFWVGDVSDYRKRHAEGDEAKSNQGWHLWSKGTLGVPTGETRYVYDPPWVYEKPHPLQADVVLERSTLGSEVNGPFVVYSYRILVAAKRGELALDDLGRLDWADWDHDGSLLFAKDGSLFRRALSFSARPALVANLRDQLFTNVRPTQEALLWPTP